MKRLSSRKEVGIWDNEICLDLERRTLQTVTNLKESLFDFINFVNKKGEDHEIIVDVFAIIFNKKGKFKMKKVIMMLMIAVFACSMVFMAAGCKEEAGTSAEVEEATEEAAEEEVAEEAAEEEVAEEEASEEYDPSEKMIYIVHTFISHPVSQAIILGCFDKAEELGYDNIRVVGTLQPDEVTTFQAGEQAISRNPDGMWFWGYAESWFPLIEKASEQGIVTTVPHIPWPEGTTDIDFNVVPDDKQEVRDAIDVLIDNVGPEGTIAITLSTLENATQKAGWDEIQSYVAEEYPDVTLLNYVEIGQEGGSSEAVSKVVALILGNPDLGGMFTLSGVGSETFARAFEETGRDDIIAIGRNDTLQNLDYVKNGAIYGVTAPPLYDEGAITMEYFDKAFRGEEFPYQTKLPAPIITQETPDLLEAHYTLQSTLLEELNSKGALEGIE
jgi:ABC-type sugar transport system substrate-binding protein